MQRRQLLSFATSSAAALFCACAGLAHAADAGPFKIGFILPMTGQSASTGKQIEAGRVAESVVGRKLPGKVHQAGPFRTRPARSATPRRKLTLRATSEADSRSP